MGKIERIFERIENNNLINVIRNGFVAAIPFLLMGAFSLLITSFPITPYQDFITEIWDGKSLCFFSIPSTITQFVPYLLILLISISYSYAKYYNSREPFCMSDYLGNFLRGVCRYECGAGRPGYQHIQPDVDAYCRRNRASLFGLV